MVQRIKKYFRDRAEHKRTMAFILEHPLTTRAHQDTYSELVDMEDWSFDAIEDLVRIAKETRIEKKKYLELKAKELNA